MLKKLKNKFETRIYKQLKRAESIFTYETEKIPFVLARHYIPDFIIQTPLGKVYVECKGYFRADDKRKLLAVKRQHPNLDIRILFYAFQESYVRWASKNRFKYAIEKVPKEWLKGL